MRKYIPSPSRIYRRYHCLNMQNDPNNNAADDNDDDDGEQPTFYNDFEEFSPAPSTPKPDENFQKLSNLISQSKEIEIQRDSRLAHNWRRGNWNVRGFALDKNSIPSTSISPATTAKTRTNSTRSRLQESSNGSFSIADGENKDDNEDDLPPVMISKVVMDETSHFGDSYGSSSSLSSLPSSSSAAAEEGRRRRMHDQILAVGRTDGSIYLVRMGLDYMTKFMAVPKLIMEGQWDSDDNAGGVENKDIPFGDGEVAGPSVRIESEMMRDEEISFRNDNENQQQKPSNTGREEEEVGIGMMEDVLPHDPNSEDDATEKDDSTSSPPMPFEIVFQFQAPIKDDYDKGFQSSSSTAINAMLFHDNILYTAGGNTGEIKVWDVSDIETGREYSSEEKVANRQQPRHILGGKDVHTDRVVALKSLARKAALSVGVDVDVDVNEHDLLLSASLDGSFALWNMADGDDYGDSLLYRGVVEVVPSGKEGEGSVSAGDTVRIQCADVDVLSGGEYVIYFGLSSGHVVGYVVSDLIDYANNIKRGAVDEKLENFKQQQFEYPKTCCQFLAHECIKSTKPVVSSHSDQLLQSGITALTCGGEGSLGLSPGLRVQKTTHVLLIGAADGTVKQYEIIPRMIESSQDNNLGNGSDEILKLEHWPRLSSQRMNRRAHMFMGHEGPITALVCGSSSGGVGVEGCDLSSSKILSAGMDGTVRIWNPSKGGRELYRMDGFTDALSSLCLDGDILVTDGMGELVCVHDFDTGDNGESDMYEF